MRRDAYLNYIGMRRDAKNTKGIWLTGMPFSPRGMHWGVPKTLREYDSGMPFPLGKFARGCRLSGRSNPL